MAITAPKPRQRSTMRLPKVGSLGVSTRFLPHVTLVVVLGLLAWVGMLQLSTPDAVPASAPATEFSAERAMDHLRAFAVEPRPIGSVGNLNTQQYLMDQIQALGLEPELQTTSVVAGSEGGPGFGAGTVTNILVRVPGTDPTGAIAINAHYDGGSTGPAASDAGSGVVAALETLRAVTAGEALKNDLIIVFADGEENGMLGAAAFNEQHPWANDVRLAINFEAQGSRGPAILYATGEKSGWLVEQFLDIAPEASGYSILPEIDRLVPATRLDCDLGEYTEEGALGLGFVYAADTPAYHTILDNTERIDPGSIQQEGDYTLSMVRHFGDINLNEMPRSTDRVFFTLLPGVVASYSFTWVLPLAALVTILVAAVSVYGIRGGTLTGRGLAAGTVSFLGATLATVVVIVAAWFAIRSLNTDYRVFLIGSYQTTLYAVAFGFLSVALMAGVYTLLRRRVRLLNLATGVLIGGTLVLWFTSIALPGISYIVAWPLLFGILPLAWALYSEGRQRSDWLKVAVLALAAVPAVILLPGTLYQVVALVNRFEGISGMPIMGVTALFIAPLVGLFLLHINMLEDLTGGRRWVLPAVAATVAFALIGWGNLTSGFDAEQPRPTQIAYQLNADTGDAQWVSFDRNLSDWTRQFFPEDAARTDPDVLFYPGMEAFVGPAPAIEVHSPDVTLLSDTTSGDLRTLTLNLAATGDAHMQMINVTAQGPVVAAAINEHTLNVADDAEAPDGELTLAYVNVPEGGWTLTLTVRSDQPVSVEVDDAVFGLPDIPGIDPRPADVMPAPGIYDPTIVKRTFSY